MYPFGRNVDNILRMKMPAPGVVMFSDVRRTDPQEEERMKTIMQSTPRICGSFGFLSGHG